ncbi:MAG: polysaccharide deacetylase family protein [Eubacterium sp.]|nr:polysaccharide deacetylase family protein [Eubacterium sp.]
MSKVILTVDDNPQKITRSVVDYLVENKIPAVLFIVGEDAEKDRESVLYAIRKGFIIGNHSYSHPRFSELTFEECVQEIEKTETVIESLYEEAGIERPVKLFRFPYIDKGESRSEEHKKRIQEYLRTHGFGKLNDSEIKAPGYYRNGWNKDVDLTFSFDCIEYLVRPGKKKFSEIMERLHTGHPEMESNVLTDESTNLVLIHSHDKTEAMEKDYFKKIVGEMIKSGVEFVEPLFT